MSLAYAGLRLTTQEKFHKHTTFGLYIKLGRGQGDGGIGTPVWGLGDTRRGTWGHQEWDAGTCGTGTRDVKYRDAGNAGTLMNVSLKYLFLRENELFMVNIRFHRPEPLWTPYDVYTKYLRI